MKTKTTEQKKEVNPTIYLWVFIHGKPGERTEESTEGCLNEFDTVTDIGYVRAIEQHLSKEYVNPKVINFIPLRKKA